MSSGLTLADLLYGTARRRIFVSYHHAGDRQYYDAFAQLMADTYEIVQDMSVERLIDSDDAEYVSRTISGEIHHRHIMHSCSLWSRDAMAKVCGLGD